MAEVVCRVGDGSETYVVSVPRVGVPGRYLNPPRRQPTRFEGQSQTAAGGRGGAGGSRGGAGMKVVDWWRRNFLCVEFGIAAAIATAFALWGAYWGGDARVDDFLQGNRGPVYGTVASILGSMLGFVIATLALVI